MVYVTIKESSKDKFVIVREPGIVAWSLLIGAVTCGLGAAYYGSDYMIWKIMYVGGAVYIGIACLGDWEVCEMNKDSGDIKLKRSSILQKTLPKYFQQHTVVSNLNEVIGVRVEEQEVKYFGKSHQVVLLFSTGICLGVTDSFTYGSSSDHYLIADKIRKFLDLENKAAFATTVNDIIDNEDTSSEDSFEQIDPSEVTTEEEVVDDSITTGVNN
ncbi:hypothetical protein SNE40_005873 [Patella caerulea]|uniref:Essential for reactive oxygen species protein n=1 Tax=Patella caerulea TaxID=87958 RepID=A0AAN8K5D5_PATCE